MTGGLTRFEEGPAASPGFQLWRVTLAWQRAMAGALSPFGLTHTQFVVLACTWWLAVDDEAPVQATIAYQAGVDVRTTSQVLRALVANGLVERTVDAVDSRARRVALTSTGHALLQRAVVAVEDADEHFFQTDAAAAQAVLRRLPGALDPPTWSTGPRDDQSRSLERHLGPGPHRYGRRLRGAPSRSYGTGLHAVASGARIDAKLKPVRAGPNVIRVEVRRGAVGWLELGSGRA